jgi:putative transposase
MAQRVGSRPLRALDPTLCLLSVAPSCVFVWCYGPEFCSRRMLGWAEERKVALVHIQPGRPMQNGHVESFHGRLRDECLNVSWFRTLADVRRTVANWREEYNCERPHSSLGYRTPAEFRQALGYAEVETAPRFPLMEWSAACSPVGLSCLAGGSPWRSRHSVLI